MQHANIAKKKQQGYQKRLQNSAEMFDLSVLDWVESGLRFSVQTGH